MIKIKCCRFITSNLLAKENHSLSAKNHKCHWKIFIKYILNCKSVTPVGANKTLGPINQWVLMVISDATKHIYNLSTGTIIFQNGRKTSKRVMQNECIVSHMICTTQNISVAYSEQVIMMTQ